MNSCPILGKGDEGMRPEELRGREKVSVPHGTSAPLLLRELAQLRQAVYRFLAALFLYPQRERVAQLIEATQVLHTEEAFAVFPFFLPWRRLLHRLRGEELLQTVELEEEYTRLFMTGPAGPLCSPYASSYLDPDRMAVGRIPAQLEQEYAAAGLMLSPSLHELPDHVSVELEYMAFLCRQEREAWEGTVWEEGVKILERERTFLERHLGRWFPAFARNLKGCDKGGLYGAAAEAAEAFILHDLDLLPLLLETLEGVD